MATPGNLEFLRQAGLVDGDIAPRPNDLLVAVRGKSNAHLEAALAKALASLTGEPSQNAGNAVVEAPLRSLQMALARSPAANLALISVPGDYAAAEAMKALRLGLHVMLFSDNVALADEVALKRYAAGRGLLVMGPDCGTAIVNGVPLGFANAVRRGAGRRGRRLGHRHAAGDEPRAPSRQRHLARDRHGRPRSRRGRRRDHHAARSRAPRARPGHQGDRADLQAALACHRARGHRRGAQDRQARGGQLHRLDRRRLPAATCTSRERWTMLATAAVALAEGSEAQPCGEPRQSGFQRSRLQAKANAMFAASSAAARSATRPLRFCRDVWSNTPVDPRGPSRIRGSRANTRSSTSATTTSPAAGPTR